MNQSQVEEAERAEVLRYRSRARRAFVVGALVLNALLGVTMLLSWVILVRMEGLAWFPQLEPLAHLLKDEDSLNMLLAAIPGSIVHGVVSWRLADRTARRVREGKHSRWGMALRASLLPSATGTLVFVGVLGFLADVPNKWGRRFWQEMAEADAAFFALIFIPTLLMAFSVVYALREWHVLQTARRDMERRKAWDEAEWEQRGASAP